MEVHDIGLGVLEITPRRLYDERGFFAETWQRQRFAAAGMDIDWVQESQSLSADANVLRGLHVQIAPQAQDKLVRVLKGSIFDVAVDVRHGSSTFGRWVSRTLSATAFNQLLIPRGFAHGFLTLEPGVEVFYKVSAPYAPECDRTIAWNDPSLGIAWPLLTPDQLPMLSPKDAEAPRLAAIADSLSF